MLDGLVLVTGAAGMIGSALVQRLLEMGCRVRAVVHQRPPGTPGRERRPDADGTVEYMPADLTKLEDCHRVAAGVDYVFHCAAVVLGAGAPAHERTLAAASTAHMLVHLCTAARDARVQKFLWLGSTIAYPDAGSRPLKEEEIFEGAPPPAYATAGTLYREGERLCKVLGEQGPMTTLVLRPSNVYGPGDQFDLARSRVVASLVRRVVERQDPLTVWGTGDDVRDLVYVDDVVRVMVLAMETAETYGAWNIGLGNGYSVRQILETLLDLEGWRPSQVVYDASKPSMIPVRLVDVSKAARELGFVARVDLRKGLKRTLQWYKQNAP